MFIRDSIIKEYPRDSQESVLMYADRMDDLALSKFVEKQSKKKLTKVEYNEATEVESRVSARTMLQSGLIPLVITDKQLKPAAERLHKELIEEFKGDTPFKRLLIDRLVSAWSMSWSYEKMLYGAKYQSSDDDTKVSFSFDPYKTKFLKEARLGIETANDQIIRLTQVLQNICNPPIHVKAKNAFFAQNQQINQGILPKDLADSSKPSHATDPSRRTLPEASHS